MALDPELLVGLQDWSIGKADEKIKDLIGDPGPYAVILTFDDPDTIGRWFNEMVKTWGPPHDAPLPHGGQHRSVR
jgi:hypothetical protein